MDEVVALKDHFTASPQRPRTNRAEPLALLIDHLLRQLRDGPRAGEFTASLIPWGRPVDPNAGVAGERPEQNGVSRQGRRLDHDEAVRVPHRIRFGSPLSAAPVNHDLLQTAAPVLSAAVPHDRRPIGPAIGVLAQRVEDGRVIATDDEEARG